MGAASMAGASNVSSTGFAWNSAALKDAGSITVTVLQPQYTQVRTPRDQPGLSLAGAVMAYQTLL